VAGRDIVRSEWFGCACCPGNITRFMASVPGYQYAVDGSKIFVNLYVQGKANLKTGSDSIILEQKTNYPWDGRVEITFNSQKPEVFELKMRIPGWALNQPVPSDLYFTRNNTIQKPELLINGQGAEYQIKNGYASLCRKWKQGDVVTLKLEMPITRIYANDSVLADKSKVALQRGPMVYCLEGKDQPTKTTFDLYIPDSAQLTIASTDSLFDKVPVITGLAGQKEKSGTKTVKFIAIPYYLWNNRGKDEMCVWINNSENAVKLRDKNPVASNSKFKASNPWFEDGPMDGFIPRNSSDISNTYFYWWHPGGDQTEWAEYSFDKVYAISESSVYWLVMNHYEQNFQVPQEWKLLYKKGEQWIPVENTSGFGVAKDQFNKVSFKPVKTNGLRLEAKLTKGFSGGIHEWTVN
jgi:hypothetical protein